jgi:hypothetical protein
MRHDVRGGDDLLGAGLPRASTRKASFGTTARVTPTARESRSSSKNVTTTRISWLSMSRSTPRDFRVTRRSRISSNWSFCGNFS